MTHDNPFEVGKVYENRLGLYQMFAIELGQDRLRVLYPDSGEEQFLTLSTQARILRNMDWDALEEKRNKAREQERLQPGVSWATYGWPVAFLVPECPNE